MRNFIIFKNQHRSTFKWIPFLTNSLKFEIRLNKTMLTQSDSIHKICGFSDGGLFHHKNSIRLGWSTEDGAIVLHSYIYKDGEREITRLMKVPSDSTLNVEMAVMGRKYMLKVNKTVYFLNRGATASCRYKHILYPYYGGRDTAPHDVIVNLNWEFPRKRWRI